MEHRFHPKTASMLQHLLYPASGVVDARSTSDGTKSASPDRSPTSVDSKSGSEGTKSTSPDLSLASVDAKSGSDGARSTSPDRSPTSVDSKSGGDGAKSTTPDRSPASVDAKSGSDGTKSTTPDRSPSSVDAKSGSEGTKSTSADGSSSPLWWAFAVSGECRSHHSTSTRKLNHGSVVQRGDLVVQSDLGAVFTGGFHAQKQQKQTKHHET